MTGATPSSQLTRKQSDLDRHIAVQIRQRRRGIGMALQRLADLIGVSYQQANKYENGTTRISAAHLHAIALAMSVDVAYFFEQLEPPCPQCRCSRSLAPTRRLDGQYTPDHQSHAPACRLRDG